MKTPTKTMAWLALLPLVAGCATIVEGSDQSVTVITDPAGAECELRRQGEVLAVINPTPGTVTVDKSQHNITVRCRREGFEDAVGTFDSEFQGMTAGNILFGGVIGLGVDAASGAMHEYDNTVTIILREAEEPEDDPDAVPETDPADPIAETAGDGAPLT
jgi:hypothetical protein